VRTRYAAAEAKERQALAVCHEVSVCVLLARGLPGISLAVHDAPRTVDVASVVI
jgi:hypothetical protein